MSLVEQIAAEIAALEAKIAALRGALAALEGVALAAPRAKGSSTGSGKQRRPPASGGTRVPPAQHPKYAEARTLSERGVALPEVAKAVGLPVTTVRNWRSRGGWK